MKGRKPVKSDRRKHGRLGLAFLGMLAGGTMFSSCATDIRHNLTAGSLSYVREAASSFWTAFIPAEDVFGGVFDRDDP